MPANMMNAALGLTLYVTGSNRATVMAGPIPGSTPTAVPSRTPMHAYSRFMGVAACSNPCSSQFRLSMSEDSVQNACGQRDSEPDVERVEAAESEHRADRDVADPVPAAEDRGGTGEQERSDDRPAEEVDQGDGGDEQGDEQSDGPPVTRGIEVDVLAAVGFTGRPAQDR